MGSLRSFHLSTLIRSSCNQSSSRLLLNKLTICSWKIKLLERCSSTWWINYVRCNYLKIRYKLLAVSKIFSSIEYKCFAIYLMNWLKAIKIRLSVRSTLSVLLLKNKRIYLTVNTRFNWRSQQNLMTMKNRQNCRKFKLFTI